MTPQTVIVTLYMNTGFEGDYELPAHLPAAQLCPLLLESLAQQEPRRFGAWKGLRLQCRGQTLGEKDTLSSCQIWDGSIIMIEEEAQ